MFKYPFAHKLILAVIFSIFLPLIPVKAWGPVSHIAISYEAGTKNGFPVSDDLVGAFLAGSTEPDVGLGDGKSEDYGVYHSENYAKAMENVADRLKSPAKQVLQARAAGIRAHIAADSAAHTNTGYANVKKMFSNLDHGMADHTTNELCVDMILYDEHRNGLKKQRLNFMDVDTMILVRKEFSKITGQALSNDRAQLQKEIISHRTMVLTELSLADHLSKNDHAKIEGMKELYSDFRTGVKEGKGVDMAVDRVSLNANAKDEAKSFSTDNKGFKILDFMNNSVLAKSFQALEKGALQLMKMKTLRENLVNLAEGKVSNSRNKAFLNFGCNLLNKDLSFKQAVLLAGKKISGYPESDELKLIYMETEAEVLKAQRDKAKEAFDNRPWWKFWLYLTKADQKKYQEAEKKYQDHLRKIDSLKANIKLDNPQFTPVAQILASEANSTSFETKKDSGSFSSEILDLSYQLNKASEEYNRAASEQNVLEVKRLKIEIENLKARIAVLKN